jgi:hypothetical protein
MWHFLLTILMSWTMKRSCRARKKYLGMRNTGAQLWVSSSRFPLLSVTSTGIYLSDGRVWYRAYSFLLVVVFAERDNVTSTKNEGGHNPGQGNI